ncbi:hypothetical protein BGX34_009225 [Mortierella sp. NVP85]|nr:hypothetical protein BGX34_009225 [Mortierella sp. NVP85]
MLCFGSISEQEIEIALGNTKAAFSNSTAVADKPASLEQCVYALKIAVDTLTKVKKDGKRALNKSQNINLKNAIEEAYKELTQLQVYFGSDKAQKCFQVAGKWRNGVNIPDPIQPQSQPQPIHESRRSVDSASLSSGGSHSIPDQFYQAELASEYDEINIHDEEISVGNTPGSSMVDLDVARIDGPNENQSKPREQYAKHTGCFADAAPRMAHSTGGGNDGLLGTTSTNVEANRADPVKNGILNPETLEIALVTSPQETHISPASENSNGHFGMSEVPDVPVIARVEALHDFVSLDEGDLSFKAGDIIDVIDFYMSTRRWVNNPT